MTLREHSIITPALEWLADPLYRSLWLAIKAYSINRKQ